MLLCRLAKLHAEKEESYSRKLETAQDTIRWTLKLLSQGKSDTDVVNAAVDEMVAGGDDVTADLSILEALQSYTGGIRALCSDQFIDREQTQQLLVLERCNRNIVAVSNEVKSFQVRLQTAQMATGAPVRARVHC